MVPQSSIYIRHGVFLPEKRKNRYGQVQRPFLFARIALFVKEGGPAIRVGWDRCGRGNR
jgi:hypothetical protein